MVDAPLPSRPLPIGAFPLPFGYLLLPATPEAEPVRTALLAGRLPADWPDSLRGHRLALAGDLDGALACFDGADAVSRFNRLVLDPDAADAVALRRDLGPELGGLVDLVLFVLGRTDTPPDAADVTGELAALTLAAHAALHLFEGRLAEAADELARAVTAAHETYPALEGVLHGAAAQVRARAGDVDAAISELQAGIELLNGTDLAVGTAELHLELGALLHEQAGDRRDLLSKAIHHYHCALQRISKDDAAELFAAAHANLASAYLTMPMVEASDKLRVGVAVASLRAALEVYRPETHPQQWSSAQLNLANALVYAPSTHQADNLVEAVELYETVLAARSRDLDPLGYARVLANQGNALAHLGVFEHARGKLAEARYIFEEMGEYDAVSSVGGVQDEIARQVALAGAQA